MTVADILFMTRERISSPEQYFGFKIGEDKKLVDWPDILLYFQNVASSSDRVLFKELGVSTEGNPFVLAIISSKTNLERLERIREVHLKIGNPVGVVNAEAEKLVNEGKAIVLITCSIHSTEVGGSQMSMELLHKLATDDTDEVNEILDNVVLLLIPSLNPDGNRLVCDWYRKYLGTQFEGTSPPMVYHKYAGHDNNRDWFMFSLKETKLAVEKVHNQWHPHIVYDIHQMGKKGPRFFVPPFIDPIDPNVDPILVSGINFVGTTMADSLTVAGKKGVTFYWEFDGWTPARAYQHYHGGIRILSEAASCDIASPVDIKEADLEGERGYKPRETRWNHPVPWRGGKWSLRDIIDYEFIASMAVLKNAAKHRERWLRGSLEIGRRALKPDGGPYAYIIPQNQRDPNLVYELLEVMRLGDVNLFEAQKEFKAEDVEYPAGSVIIPISQPYGRFAKTLLEKQVYPDLRKNLTDPPEVPYDVTAQTLGLQMGVEVVEVKTEFKCEMKNYEPSRPKGQIKGNGSKYFIFPSELTSSTKVVNRLLSKGYKIFRTEGWEEVDGEVLKPGAFMIENIEGLSQDLEDLFTLGVPFYAIDDYPEVSFEVVEPRLGVYRPWLPSADEAWLRMVLEEYTFDYTSVSPQDLRRGNLSEKLDVLIIPDIARDQIVDGLKAIKGSEPNRYEANYREGVGEEGTKAILKFLEEGGSIIALNKACVYAIKDLLIPVENPLEGLKEQDFYIPGSILRVTLDETHPVAYGYPREAAVYFIGGPALKAKEGALVAKYPEANPILSGWILGEKQLRGLGAIADIPISQGRVILFGFPPHFRNQARGTFKILFNAIYYCASGV